MTMNSVHAVHKVHPPKPDKTIQLGTTPSVSKR
jgi:hypothetical protein